METNTAITNLLILIISVLHTLVVTEDKPRTCIYNSYIPLSVWNVQNISLLQNMLGGSWRGLGYVVML